jgi:hypothetical protein
MTRILFSLLCFSALLYGAHMEANNHYIKSFIINEQVHLNELTDTGW